MATQWETYPIEFTGGWRTDLGRLNQGIIAPGSATILQNYEPSIDGGYKRISGYSKFDDEEVPGSGFIVGTIVVDEVRCLVLRNGVFYLSSGNGWDTVDSAASSNGVRTRHAKFNFDGNENIVIVDGFSPPTFFNTSSNTITIDSDAEAEAIGANNVVVFKNHLFFAKNNFLTFTAPYTSDDYNTGNGAGQINVGGLITGLIVFREQLIVFCRDKIWRLQGNTSSDFVLQSVADNTGCLCPHTVKEVGGDILYLGPDGIRWLSATERNNDFGLERASKNIQKEILQRISTDCGYTSITINSKNQYRLFFYLDNVPREFSEGVLTTLYTDQSVENIQWAKLVGMKIYTGDHQQFRDREITLFSSDTDFVYRMDSGNSFDGESIETIFETPYMPINDPRVRKTVYKHDLYAQTQGNFSLNVFIRYDFNREGIIQPAGFNIGGNSGVESVYGSPFSIYGTSIYTTVMPTEFRNNTVGSGFTVAIRYQENSTNPPHTLQHTTLEFATNERR